VSTAKVWLLREAVGQVMWPAQVAADLVIPPARTSCRAPPRSPSARIMRRCSSHRCSRGSLCHLRWKRCPGRTGVRSTWRGQCCPRRTSEKGASSIRRAYNICVRNGTGQTVHKAVAEKSKGMNARWAMLVSKSVKSTCISTAANLTSSPNQIGETYL